MIEIDDTFDPTKPVQLRNGAMAVIIRTNLDDENFPILVLIDNKVPGIYTKDGLTRLDGVLSGYDIVNTRPSKTYMPATYYCILREGGGIWTYFDEEHMNVKFVPRSDIGRIVITTDSDGKFEVEKYKE